MQGRRGRYVLGELLGRGGMAVVYAGHAIGSLGFQKPVAIKRLLPELSTDLAQVERLVEEAMLLVGMEHGNLVRVLDLERDDDDVFLVMELVDGPSLRQLIRARGRRGVPLGVATYIVQSAAAGLEFTHARSVIHADVSPSNVLLTTSGEVRVADFGIARVAGRSPGIIEGKWAYMAPEHARGAPLTPGCDVFALGVVLYELITGVHPFGRTGMYSDTAAHEITSRPVVAPSTVRSDVPDGIDAICMRALAHDARDRYSSMRQLIDALVVERFANAWSEGASDLAHVIRELDGPPIGGHWRTGPRQRIARGSAPQIEPGVAPLLAPTPPRTVELAPPRTVEPAPAPTVQLAPPRTIEPAPARTVELAPARGADRRVTGARLTWWACAVLGIAALVGAIAAIKLVPNDVHGAEHLNENLAAFEHDDIVALTPASSVERALPEQAPSTPRAPIVNTIVESHRPRAPAPASRPARRPRPRHVAKATPAAQPPPVSTTAPPAEPTRDAPKKPHDNEHDLLPPE